MPEGYKTCCRCGQSKPDTPEFFARQLGKLTSACRECLRSKDRERYWEHHDEIREKKRQSESRKVTTRKYRQSHKEQLTAAMRVYYQTHPEYREKQLELKKKYSREHPEKNSEWLNARRARKLSSGGRYTTKEWKALKDYYGNVCLCCGAKEVDVHLEPDHIVPLAVGGSNSIDNIQPLCRSCNASKYTKTIDYRLVLAAAA